MLGKPIELLQLLDLTGEPVSLRIELSDRERMRLVVVARDWRNLNSVLVKVMGKSELVELIDKLKEVANRMKTRRE